MNVLLKPAIGYRKKLLRMAFPGAIPPISIYDDKSDTWWHGPQINQWCPSHEYWDANTALVLAWESIPIIEGCDRAARVLALAVPSELWLPIALTMDDVNNLAARCQEHFIGTIIKISK